MQHCVCNYNLFFSSVIFFFSSRELRLDYIQAMITVATAFFVSIIPSRYCAAFSHLKNVAWSNNWADNHRLATTTRWREMMTRDEKSCFFPAPNVFIFILKGEKIAHLKFCRIHFHSISGGKITRNNGSARNSLNDEICFSCRQWE